MPKVRDMNSARFEKKDEFYTRLKDIASELKHYSEHFTGKTIYCNCDDYRVSNFAKYFCSNFELFGLKKLIVSGYKSKSFDLFEDDICESAVWLEYDGVKKEMGEFSGDGDFRSNECIELLKQSDIVVTNPPFSLFREFVGQLVEYDKKFLIIGNKNAVTYKEIFPLFMENKIWFGRSGMNRNMVFDVPEHYGRDNNTQLISACWFTNLDFDNRHHDLDLLCGYDTEKHPKYDCYDAINVDTVKDIPFDYFGVMGVPITFLGSHNPDQFDILGIDRYVIDNPFPGKRFSIGGKDTYARVLIKRKKR